MSALNLIKLQDRQPQSASAFKARKVISVASWKIRKANEQLLERCSSYLGLDFNRIKSRPDFERQRESVRTIVLLLLKPG
jgi:hypothetical protein